MFVRVYIDLEDMTIEYVKILWFRAYARRIGGEKII
jgi:hypothetical protein